MLIFILIDVQHLQKTVFSFEKGSNRQNHSSSGSLYLVEKIPPVKFQILPNHLPPFWKNPIYKTLWLLFVDGVQLPQGYTELL